MAKLKPITETCVPREDVRTGQLTDAHFAAQLDRIVRDPGAYPVYGDPDEFFALTYPTTGLQNRTS
jgi:predicted AAA+ superfamily ATPase